MPRITNHIAKVYPDKVPEDMSIILIGSMNYKMKSYGPKPLLKLNCGKTFIDYQIQTIQKVFPNAEIILCVGQDADRIVKNKPYKLKIVENQRWEETNTTEYARLALNSCINNRVVLIDSDLYFDTVILNQIKNVKHSCLYYDDSGRLPPDEIGITIAQGYATYFSFKHDTKWCHVAHFVNDDVTVLRNILADKNRRRYFLYESLNIFVEKRPLRVERSESKTLYRIETSRDLEKIKNET